MHGSLIRWQVCNASTNGKCELLADGSKREDDGFDAWCFTFAKSAFLKALWEGGGKGRGQISSYLVPEVVEESAAVVQVLPHGRDQERVVGLPVPPIVEEVEAVVQAKPQERDQGHSF